MYQLHIANKNYSSWSLRPWVLMRTLAIPFTETLHPFRTQDNSAAFRLFSPTGKVPMLEDGATGVWESLAIAEYLAEAYSKVWPQEKQARAWARSAAAEMHAGFSALRNDCPMNCGIRVRQAARSDALERDLARLDALWQDGLARFGGPFLAGAAFSAADAFFAPVVFRIQTYHLPLSPQAQRWCQMMLALPAMEEWYQAALQEAYRDEEHEEDALRKGEAIADYRQPVDGRKL